MLPRAGQIRLGLVVAFLAAAVACTTYSGDPELASGARDPGVGSGDAANAGATAKGGTTSGPYCGDGNVDAPDEACDDSVNTSKYGGCAPGCKAGPYCGDGIVQAQEACDDGKFAGAYGGCAQGCVLGPRCGDKVVQEEAGEGCDDGNHKNLDGCSATCKIEQPK